jgi:hypothetical protein
MRPNHVCLVIGLVAVLAMIGPPLRPIPFDYVLTPRAYENLRELVLGRGNSRNDPRCDAPLPFVPIGARYAIDGDRPRRDACK